MRQPSPFEGSHYSRCTILQYPSKCRKDRRTDRMQCTVWPLKVSGRDSRKRFASLALSHRLLGRDQRRRTLCSRPPPTGIVGGEGDGHKISASKSLIFLGSGTFYATMLTSLHMLTPYVVSCHSYRWTAQYASCCLIYSKPLHFWQQHSAASAGRPLRTVSFG